MSNPTWDELCERGRLLSKKDDEYRWRLGDLAKHVDRHYRDKGIEEFAKEIGRNKSTVYQYSAISRMFPKSLRRRILRECPNLTYTYFRTALRLKDQKQATAWLYEASDNGWTADESARKLTERLKRIPRESMEGEIHERYHEAGETFLVIRLDSDYELEAGQRLVIKPKREAVNA